MQKYEIQMKILNPKSFFSVFSFVTSFERRQAFRFGKKMYFPISNIPLECQTMWFSAELSFTQHIPIVHYSLFIVHLTHRRGSRLVGGVVLCRAGTR